MKKIKYSTSDYNPMFLPQNRKELFNDIYKTRFSVIFKCGLLLLLFSLPLLIAIFILDLGKFGTSSLTSEQLTAFSFYWNLILRICIIAFMYVFLVGLCGVFRILKLLIWQEGIDFWYDFKIGVKDNYKSMVIPCLIFTILYCGCYAIIVCFTPGLVLYGAIAILSLVFLPILLWSFYLNNMYNAKTKEILTNSLFFFGKTIGWTLFYMILIALPFFYEYFNIPFSTITLTIKTIVYICLIVFYYPFLLVVGLLYSCKCFDKHINQDAYPEIYRKGLFDPSKIKDNVL